MTGQDNRDIGTHVNSTTFRLRDFVRMNPPKFLVSKVREDPQEFMDEVYKRLDAMGVTSVEKAELAAYRLKDVAQVWFNQEKGSGSPFPKSTCTKCGKKHHGKCLAGIDGCYGCGKSDHQVKNCPTLAGKGREAKQASLNGTVPIPPNYGRFYALRSREEKGALPDEGTGYGKARGIALDLGVMCHVEGATGQRTTGATMGRGDLDEA
ncbi:uncharacterized protein LOC125877324 [Solanum stenotomum]|uniref:uncharacterized protein LOC125877324 n=1 Tax=Solanum stenotomum TaxID=172797 RepID=UPI0020D1D5ED|nr:uncharacterized protein LOC125877324 [Solanum stenotomum]